MQPRQFLIHDQPDRIDVDRQVVMHKDIPEAGYRTPRDVGLACLDPDRIGQTLTRFRQRLQIANNRILNQP